MSAANQEAMRAVTEYLIELGHRRIAYLGDRNSYRPDAARQAGYKAARRAGGSDLHPN